jgi:galactokinase
MFMVLKLLLLISLGMRVTLGLSMKLNKSTPSTLAHESADIKALVSDAKDLYTRTFLDDSEEEKELICCVAPGRVNLIGEHVDYTGGFVFPMAIAYSTVCIGRGSIVTKAKAECRVVSCNKEGNVIRFVSGRNMIPLPPGNSDSWTNYVAGVVDQYQQLLPDENLSFSLDIAISGNVPLGSGLSSSASLEVAVATFLEKLIRMQYPNVNLGGMKEKALRCQKAENVFCSSPCGIMDQYVSAAGRKGSAVLIDCRNLDLESVEMGGDDGDDKPVFVICNSNVKHSIGGGEYPVRVRQCAEATKILREVYGDGVNQLRDVSIDMLDAITSGEESALDNLIYRRARHVVTENVRTLQAKDALIMGQWKKFGQLMNESHESMKTDYEVSCEEIDILVDLAQNFDGVYGSRLTGGGFGGCTVTLVDKSRVHDLCEYMKIEYKKRTGKDCVIFETSPGAGARELFLMES